MIVKKELPGYSLSFNKQTGDYNNIRHESAEKIALFRQGTQTNYNVCQCAFASYYGLHSERKFNSSAQFDYSMDRIYVFSAFCVRFLFRVCRNLGAIV